MDPAIVGERIGSASFWPAWPHYRVRPGGRNDDPGIRNTQKGRTANEQAICCLAHGVDDGSGVGGGTDSLGNIVKTIHISAANLNQFVNEPQSP